MTDPTPRPAALDNLLGYVAANLPSEPGTAPAPLPPAVVSAILRDPDSPYYPTQITVFCDHCGARNTGDYMVRDDMTSEQRLAVARKYLATHMGWEHTADGDDFCPEHAGSPDAEQPADRPYTDDDLRAEAARQLANLSDHLDADRVGQEMCGWDEVLDDEQFGKAERAVHGLIKGAADVSEWAVNLGADGLEPSTEHAISVDAGRPIARIHFAFEPDMPDEMRTALVEGIGDSINDALGDDANEETDESGDSDSDVFDLISDIASRLRDATDSGEYHAVGLIYDLANGRTTVAEARAELAEITFRHV